ncbi:MAG: response regulator [Firmicutes bacterium]|nr:response regulator [Bacillota bacterium]
MLIVDDSAFVRARLARAWQEAGWETAEAADGARALAALHSQRPDLITLDVAMPGPDGIETARAIRQAGFRGPVLMLSALTARGAHITLEALEAGADDFVLKPQDPREVAEAVGVLEARYRALTAARRPEAVPEGTPGGRTVRTRGFRAVTVASSTGGPSALARLLPGLPPPPVPLVLVQHMPPGFTAALAERLTRLSGWPVEEAPAAPGAVCWQPGRAVLAQGGLHLHLNRHRAWAQPGPRLHGVAPAADITVGEAVRAWAPDLAVVILTGMGEDGARAAANARRLGCTVVVESAATATVWGMPQAVVRRGAADAVWPLPEIHRWLGAVFAAAGPIHA